MSIFLKVSGLEFAYGEVTVLRGLDLEIEEATKSITPKENIRREPYISINLPDVTKNDEFPIAKAVKNHCNVEKLTPN